MARAGRGLTATLAAFAVCVACSEAKAENVLRVAIEKFAFDPQTIAARVGDRIVFVNRDELPHSVVGLRGEEEVFRSVEQMDTDDSFEVVIDGPGDIAIVCGLHASMTGNILVGR
ncbi:MAG TPA: cupredoxin domain-containing protein [Methylocystis sp.]|nr:cupredoxin domain-containing protein [Methylocystis sp.]